MTLARFQSTAVDTQGNVIPAAQVTVRSQATGLTVSIFSDRNGSFPLSNPFNSDSNGYFGFHVAGGLYRISISDGVDTSEITYVGIGKVQENEAIQVSENGNALIVANSSDPALRVTQTGAGNAFVVEDSANPDATPFVVTAAGSVNIGTTNTIEKLNVEGNFFIGEPSTLSGVRSISSLGVNYIQSGSNNVAAPLHLGNWYSAGHVVIEAGGNVGVGTSSPSVKLDVRGNLAIGASMTSGQGVSTGDCQFEIGVARTADGNSYIDLHSTSGGDYNTRILRQTGVNGNFTVLNTGTGEYKLQNGAGPMSLLTSDVERLRIDADGQVNILGPTLISRSGITGSTYEPELYVNTSESITSGSGFYIANGMINTRTGGTGNRETLHVEAISSANANGEFLVGIQTIGHATGTGSGSAFGIGAAGWVDSTTNAGAECCAGEFNTIVESATVVRKAGVQIYDGATSVGSGTVYDAGMIIGKQSSASAGYLNGIQFGSAIDANQQAIKTNGRLIIAYNTNTMTAGIDLSLISPPINAVFVAPANCNGFYFGNTGGGGKIVCSTTSGGLTINFGNGGIGIGGAPNASAALDVTSTTGGILFPRMTTTQRNAISTPADGLVVYNTTDSKLQVRAGGTWVDLH